MFARLGSAGLVEATLAIVLSWERFDRSQPFAPWARGVARRVALASLRKGQRTVLGLDADVLEGLGLELDALGREADLEERRQRLRLCVGRLPGHSRDLVRRRYFDDESYADIARHTGRTIVALYKAYSRIHEALARCVKTGLQPV